MLTWNVLLKFVQSTNASLTFVDAGRYQLNQLFRFDNRSQIDSREDLATLKGFIYEAFVRIVSDNLPSPGNIVNPMPANPLKVTFSKFYLNYLINLEFLLSLLGEPSRFRRKIVVTSSSSRVYLLWRK